MIPSELEVVMGRFGPDDDKRQFLHDNFILPESQALNAFASRVAVLNTLVDWTLKAYFSMNEQLMLSIVRAWSRLTDLKIINPQTISPKARICINLYLGRGTNANCLNEANVLYRVWCPKDTNQMKINKTITPLHTLTSITTTPSTKGSLIVPSTTIPSTIPTSMTIPPTTPTSTASLNQIDSFLTLLPLEQRQSMIARLMAITPMANTPMANTPIMTIPPPTNEPTSEPSNIEIPSSSTVTPSIVKASTSTSGNICNAKSMIVIPIVPKKTNPIKTSPQTKKKTSGKKDTKNINDTKDAKDNNTESRKFERRVYRHSKSRSKSRSRSRTPRKRALQSRSRSRSLYRRSHRNSRSRSRLQRRSRSHQRSRSLDKHAPRRRSRSRSKSRERNRKKSRAKDNKRSFKSSRSRSKSRSKGSNESPKSASKQKVALHKPQHQQQKEGTDQKNEKNASEKNSSNDKGFTSMKAKRPPPPKHYICRKCDIAGHWLEDCVKYVCYGCGSKEHAFYSCPDQISVDIKTNENNEDSKNNKTNSKSNKSHVTPMTITPITTSSTSLPINEAIEKTKHQPTIMNTSLGLQAFIQAQPIYFPSTMTRTMVAMNTKP